VDLVNGLTKKSFRNPYPESGKICFDRRVYSTEPDEKEN
jgi:hypothetical protein